MSFQSEIAAMEWGGNHRIKLRLPDLPPLESTPIGKTVTILGLMGSYWAAARYLRDEGGWVRVAWNGAFASGFWVEWPAGATDAAEMAVDIPSPWEWSRESKDKA